MRPENFVFLVFLLIVLRVEGETPSYLGQVTAIAVFTAREGARGVYPRVFGSAVLATLTIGLPRPILLWATADIGPAVESHCFFPPPFREPDDVT